jgi:nicotinamidase-related amidase
MSRNTQKQYDYRIKVVEEATAGTSPEGHRAALQALDMDGIVTFYFL